MVDNKKDDGSSDEFEDINFDDFSEADLDEAQLEEEMAGEDIPEDDFSDENFTDDDWQDDEEESLGEVDQNLLTQGKTKGLSFNTIVMIGAFIVGAGVLGINIMVQSGKSAGTGGSMFQSVLNIGGVMDREFFGAEEKEKTPEEIAAQEAQTQNEGFLNNPGVLVPSDQPPQPTPIAPPEEAPTDNQPLTPMPDATAQPGTPTGEMPRGPEDGAPESNVAIAELPADAQTPPASTTETTPTTTPSAEDILKEAMANREKAAAPVEEAPPVPTIIEPVKTPPPAETIAEAPKAEEKPAEPKTPVKAADILAPATPAVAPEALAENTKAVEALDERLDTLLKRMDQIESDLGTVKSNTGKPADTSALEQTIESLKTEIAELKNRPAAPAAEAPKKARKPVPLEEPVAEADEPEVEVAEAPKPAPKKKASSKPKSAPKAAATASSGRWELRAAQPGRAWVSKPGERDMQSVEIGQSLPGIGRVTGIVYQGGRWTVQGTSGQINQ